MKGSMFVKLFKQNNPEAVKQELRLAELRTCYRNRWGIQTDGRVLDKKTGLYISKDNLEFRRHTLEMLVVKMAAAQTRESVSRSIMSGGTAMTGAMLAIGLVFVSLVIFGVIK